MLYTIRLQVFLTVMKFAEDDSASVATAKVVEAACTKSEDNKDAFMTENIGDLFGQALLAEGASVDVVRAVSRAVVKLTTADDDRPTVSRSVPFTLFTHFSEYDVSSIMLQRQAVDSI